MGSGYRKPTAFREIDFLAYVRHYAALLWRWRLWLLFAGPLSGGLALLLFLSMEQATPELAATAMIGSDPVAGIALRSAQTEAEGSTQAELIKSRNYLKNVVNTLSLRLHVSRLPRNAVFDSVAVDSSAPLGSYRLTVDKGETPAYRLWRKAKLFRRELLAEGPVAGLERIEVPGATLRLSPAFRADPRSFKFAILDIREAVELLHANLTVGSPDKYNENVFFNVSVTGRDYQLITTTVNTIADKFVEKNLSMRQARSQSMFAVLEKQFAKAREELERAEAQLKAYRTANPTVGLSHGAEQTVTALTEVRRSSAALTDGLEEARRLQAKYYKSSGEEAIAVCREILVFLSGRNSSTAAVLQAELTLQLAEQRELARGYDASHPQLQEKRAVLNGIAAKTIAELNTFLTSGQRQISGLKEEAAAMSHRIQALPAKEIELAELVRLQRVNAEIYAKALDKYNQAKVDGVVKMPGVYVMDYAVAPLPPPPNLTKLMLICLLLVLLTLLGPIVVADLIRKTVRTEAELRAILPVTVLAQIPRIIPARPPRSGAAPRPAKGPGQLLLTREYKEPYIKELFRALRTKVMLGLREQDDKCLALTSLKAGEGKSTMAANLAISLAHQNIKTLLIDADMRLGTLHTLFGMTATPGLSEFLSAAEPIAPEIARAQVRPTEVRNLWLIPAGAYVDNAAELIAGQRLRQLKQALAGQFDIVIIDAPPFGVTADAVALHDLCSRYLIVVRAGSTNVVDLKKKIIEYPALKSSILGTVLNCAAVDTKLSYYKSSKYY